MWQNNSVHKDPSILNGNPQWEGIDEACVYSASEVLRNKEMVGKQYITIPKQDR